VDEDHLLTEYLTEQEQVELLKQWVKQYSLVILAGLLISFATISGWRYWQARQLRTLHHASAVYDEMLTARAQNNSATTQVQSEKLFTHYSGTTYAQMAALMLARDAVYLKNFAEAEKQLKWVIAHSDVRSFRQIARIRLARIYINENKADESLEVLNKVDDKSFNGLTDEVRGDAWLAKHDNAKAREAYQSALNELPNAEVIRPLLQMKFDNLAPSAA
jgi:predicted negative regulator of RcsB-dependent stress response